MIYSLLFENDINLLILYLCVYVAVFLIWLLISTSCIHTSHILEYDYNNTIASNDEDSSSSISPSNSDTETDSDGDISDHSDMPPLIESSDENSD